MKPDFYTLSEVTRAVFSLSKTPPRPDVTSLEVPCAWGHVVNMWQQAKSLPTIKLTGKPKCRQWCLSKIGFHVLKI